MLRYVGGAIVGLVSRTAIGFLVGMVIALAYLQPGFRPDPRGIISGERSFLWGGAVASVHSLV